MTQQTVELSGRWKALGLQRGFEPGPAWRRRILLLAHAGFGKTTWASSNPRALVLDFEDGAADVAEPAAHRISIRDDEQMVKLGEELVKLAADPKRPFDVIVFDTIDTWVELSIAKFCLDAKIRDIGDYDTHGGGYRRVRNVIFPLMDRLWLAGYGWICTGHLVRTTVGVGASERTVVEPALSPSFRAQVFKRAQYILYAQRMKVPLYEPKIDPKTDKPYLDPDGAPRLFSTGRNTTEYRIDMGNSDSDDEKARVPLAANLVVGETDGWQVYVDAYNVAVADLQARIEGPAAEGCKAGSSK